MADLTPAAEALVSILAPLTTSGSTEDYTPAITSGAVSLLVVPFEQRGAMGYAGTGKYSIVHAHVIPCEFWIKVDTADVGNAMETGRDICLQAMRLLAANPTLNGAVQQIGSSFLGETGVIGRYDILPRIDERSGKIPLIIARLFVPVEIRETAAY